MAASPGTAFQLPPAAGRHPGHADRTISGGRRTHGSLRHGRRKTAGSGAGTARGLRDGSRLGGGGFTHHQSGGFDGPRATELSRGGLRNRHPAGRGRDEGWSGADQPELLQWVRERSDTARRYGSVCTGAFVLAQAGLLNGQRATTHWYFCQQLQREYPEVIVDPEPIYLREGRLFTSAGVASGLDLALAMVEEDFGQDIALRIARALVLFCGGRAVRISSARRWRFRVARASLCASCRSTSSNT